MTQAMLNAGSGEMVHVTGASPATDTLACVDRTALPSGELSRVAMVDPRGDRIGTKHP
jgi:hypothetical protein